MKLSIITINYNDAKGLKKTLDSTLNQTCTEFEHCIIDGASTDNSVDVIKEYESKATLKGIKINWISEKDSGIYNAMNKGIKLSKSEYIQILNSGDCLYKNDIVERMYSAITKESVSPEIFYGNMMKSISDNRIIRDRGFAGRQATFLDFHTGTLNHSPAYIKRSLFDKFGFYDESLRIVSDWKWYLEVLILGATKITYTDIDVTLFDMNGISSTNSELDKAERKQILDSLFPKAVLADYEEYSFPISQIKRLKKHRWAYKIFYIFERCFFKWDKWFHNKEQNWR